MSSGVFAIIGVALGSVLTYLLQSRMARRAEEFSRTKRLRIEQMDAFSGFASRTMDARSAQINRWYRHNDRGSAKYEAAKAESYQYRVAARREGFRVQLVTQDRELLGLAEEAVESLGAIHRSASKAEMEALADKTKTRVESFVAAAAVRLSSEAALVAPGELTPKSSS